MTRNREDCWSTSINKTQLIFQNLWNPLSIYNPRVRVKDEPVQNFFNWDDLDIVVGWNYGRFHTVGIVHLKYILTECLPWRNSSNQIDICAINADEFRVNECLVLRASILREFPCAKKKLSWNMSTILSECSTKQQNHYLLTDIKICTQVYLIVLIPQVNVYTHLSNSLWIVAKFDPSLAIFEKYLIFFLPCFFVRQFSKFSSVGKVDIFSRILALAPNKKWPLLIFWPTYKLLILLELLSTSVLTGGSNPTYTLWINVVLRCMCSINSILFNSGSSPFRKFIIR